MKFDEIYKKVINSCRAFEQRRVPISIDLKIEDLRDALVESNDMIEKLKQKLEDAKATAYTESVDAGMRERRLKRTLWLARAEMARSSALSYHLIESHPDRDMAATYKRKANKWEKAKDKCLDKAEEYK